MAPAESSANDVVADLEVTVQACDEAAAVQACAAIAERAAAVVLRAERVPDDEVDEGPVYEVRLARVEPLQPGEAVQDGLARVAARLLEALGRTEEMLPDHPRRLSSVSFVDDDGELLPAGSFVSAVVRMRDMGDPFEAYERLVPEPAATTAAAGPADAEVAELLAFASTLAMTKIVLIGETVGWDGITAREALAALVRDVDHEVFVGEPIVGDDGAVRVWAVLGASPDPAGDLFRDALSRLTVTGWEVLEERDSVARAQWVPPERPLSGFVRLELQVGAEVTYSGDGVPVLAS